MKLVGFRMSAGAALLALAVLAGAAAAASPYGLVLDEAALPVEIREPLFAFVLTMTERDSLGTWTADDLAAYAKAWGDVPIFPILDHLDSLTREVVADQPPARIRDVICRRRWVVRLRPERLEMPMPYSILGYRPGKLSFDSPLVLLEWKLGPRDLLVELRGGTQALDVKGLTIYTVAGGWLVLDVHAWLDRLLGDLIEDGALEGFVAGRLDGELIGVGNGTGRSGRRIFGEFDFRTGTVISEGRAPARALSRYARTWTRPPGFEPSEIWRAYKGR